MRHPSAVAVLLLWLLAASPGLAGAQAAPRTLETLGLEVGQSADEVDSLTRAMGYVLQSRKTYPAVAGLPAQVAEVFYVKRNPQGERQAAIGIGFGPLTGKALVIAREETFDKPVPVSAVRAELIQKYGPALPSEAGSHELHWAALKDWSSPNSLSKCWPAAYPVVSYQQDLPGHRHCRSGVEVLLGKGASSFSVLKLSLADFDRYVSEWSAYTRRLKEAQRADAPRVPSPSPAQKQTQTRMPIQPLPKT